MAQKADSRKRRPAARRDLLETLEPRQLMAGFNANFNFRATYEGVPAGYTADVGKGFAWQGNYESGWNANNTGNAVNRGTGTNRTDTFAYLGKAGGASKWEISVPNGQYDVKVTAGDAAEAMGHYGIAVENTTLVDATPSWGSLWADGAGRITVADGRLTVSGTANAWNNKITSISITQVTDTTAPTVGGASNTSGLSSAAPKAPGWASSWAAGTTVGVGWEDKSANEAGYIIERSTDGWTFTEVGRVGANVDTFTIAGQNAWTNYAFRVKGYNAAGTTAASPVTWVSTGAPSAPTAPTWTPTPVAPPVTTPVAPPATTPAPSTITWAAATGGANAVNLIWGDVANEAGYTIQRSTDGWTYTNVGTVDANVTTFANTGLASSTKYYYRIQAFNGTGTSNAAQADATTAATYVAPPTTWTPTPAPTTTPNVFNKSALTGMVPKKTAAYAIPLLQQLGMQSVRLWYGINSWSEGVKAEAVTAIRQYKNAGFTVTLAVCTPVVPDPASAKAMFQRLGSSELRGLVDYWEINNEPNHPTYWYGTPQQYVQNMLKPAYEALHALGEPVIGGAVTYDVAAAKVLESYGYSNYVDYSGFHPYGETGAIVVQRARDAKAALGNKPMIVTEWNIVSTADNATWAREINIAASGLSQICVQNYYYSLVVDSSSVGRGGAFNADGSHNGAIFDVIYGWVH